MIWLTWRQFRGSAWLMGGLLVVVAAVVAATGPSMYDDYTSGLAECAQQDKCNAFFDGFFDNYTLPFLAVTLAVLLLPAIVGVFWGAPLITRELEAGTHLLVWNQSVTRSRWLAVKLGMLGVIAVACAAACGLLVSWWSGPLDRSAQPGFAVMDPLVFSARGIAPLGYAAFAFVLGVTLGILLRRTLPAMALTLLVFVSLQVAMPMLVRPHLIAPVTATFPLSMENLNGFGINQNGQASIQIDSVIPGHTGAWVLDSRIIDKSNAVVDDGSGEAVIHGISTTSGPCGPGAGPPGAQRCMAELSKLGYRQLATYQPLDRFWPLQLIETGIYLLLSAGLTWLSFRWIRRRVS